MQTLEKLGLTKNEIKLYLELSKKRDSTSGPLMNSLNLSSSRTYAALNSLIQKGLITFFIKNNTKHFKAEDPTILLKQANNLKKETEKIVNEIKHGKNTIEQEEYSSIYQGFNGFKQAFQFLISNCDKGDEIYTIGFSPQEYGFKTLQTFLKQIDMQRCKKKISMRVLFDTNTKSTIGKDREKEPFTEVRYLPKGHTTPSAVNIFKDYVMHVVWAKQPTIFLIKSKEVSESFRNYFGILWKMSR